MKKRQLFQLLSLFIVSIILQTKPIFSESLPKWGVVFGLGKTTEEAKQEISDFKKNARLKVYQNQVAIFFSVQRGKYYSAVLFNSEEDARKANTDKIDPAYDCTPEQPCLGEVPIIPYVVNLAVWCPNWFVKDDTNKKPPNFPYPYFVCKAR